MSHWRFPLDFTDLTNTERLTSLPGEFGYKRSYYFHQGIDLYVTGEHDVKVFTAEAGVVVAIEDFTGPPDHPHWLYTQAVLVEGKTGVICYGEIEPVSGLEVGDEVKSSTHIAHVRPVIPEGLERHDIFGHSRWMLHFEWYTHGTRESVSWHHEDEYPLNLRNPSIMLQESWKHEKVLLANVRKLTFSV